MSVEQFEILKTLIPVLLGIVTLIGGGVVYNWQKGADRKNQILQERRELYRRFIGKAQKLQIHRTTKNIERVRADYPDFKVLLAELLVTAPDNVVGTLKDMDVSISALLSRVFSENSNGESFGDQTDEATLVAKAQKDFDTTISQMRKDSFEKTEFTAGLISEILRTSGVFFGR